MAYTRVNWQDGPQGGTPLSAANLNVMDVGLEEAHELLDAATPNATPLTLIRRDSSGRARVVAPTENTHIANKGYVDNLVDNLGTSDSTPNTVIRRDGFGVARVRSLQEHPQDIANMDQLWRVRNFTGHASVGYTTTFHYDINNGIHFTPGCTIGWVHAGTRILIWHIESVITPANVTPVIVAVTENMSLDQIIWSGQALETASGTQDVPIASYQSAPIRLIALAFRGPENEPPNLNSSIHVTYSYGG